MGINASDSHGCGQSTGGSFSQGSEASSRQHVPSRLLRSGNQQPVSRPSKYSNTRPTKAKSPLCGALQEAFVGNDSPGFAGTATDERKGGDFLQNWASSKSTRGTRFEEVPSARRHQKNRKATSTPPKPLGFGYGVKLESKLRLGKAIPRSTEHLTEAMNEFQTARKSGREPRLQSSANRFFSNKKMCKTSRPPNLTGCPGTDYRQIFSKQLAFAPALRDDPPPQTT